MSSSDAVKTFKFPRFFLKFWEGLKKRVWYLHPKIDLQLSLPAAEVYQLLELNSKPSIKRLEYRKLYTAGRRYLLRRKDNGGFTMMTTEKVWWYPRARSNSLPADQQKILREEALRAGDVASYGTVTSWQRSKRA